MKIKFSHDYPKLHGQTSALLLAVYACARSSLVNEFIIYDTRYYSEHGEDGENGYLYYDLPNGRVLCLVFLGNDLIPFTTVRRWTEEKERYYRENVNKRFGIELLPQTVERAKTTPNSAMVPCQKCAHNSCGDGQCHDWPICTVVYDKFLPQHQ